MRNSLDKLEKLSKFWRVRTACVPDMMTRAPLCLVLYASTAIGRSGHLLYDKPFQVQEGVKEALFQRFGGCEQCVYRIFRGATRVIYENKSYASTSLVCSGRLNHAFQAVKRLQHAQLGIMPRPGTGFPGTGFAVSGRSSTGHLGAGLCLPLLPLASVSSPSSGRQAPAAAAAAAVAQLEV